jgi:hypothetical protein
MSQVLSSDLVVSTTSSSTAVINTIDRLIMALLPYLDDAKAATDLVGRRSAHILILTMLNSRNAYGNLETISLSFSTPRPSQVLIVRTIDTYGEEPTI